MRCPLCNLENPSSARFCDCGYDFSSGGEAVATGVPPGQDAAHRVSSPGQLGLVFSVLGILTSLGFLAARALGLENINFSAIDMGDPTLDLVSSILFLTIAAVAHALGVVGWLNFKNLRSRRWAWVGPISLLVPFSCCCFMGLIPAIWGVVVLLDRKVKSAFDS